MGTPQFQKAEYGAAAAERCKLCSQPLGATYYRVNGAVACQACADKAKGETPKDGHIAFTRGLIFGIGGAVVGLVLYAGFTIVTGLIIGYVSLAVGYIVGKAIKLGSKGAGGRRYQIAALILTYMAVSLAAVPIGISQVMKERAAQHQTQSATRAPSDNPSIDAPAASQPDSQDAPADTPPQRKHVSRGSIVLSLLYLGLASPFLDLSNSFSGIIGLVILGVGLRIAWRTTAGDESGQVVGPFKNAAPAAASAGAPPSLG
jgi:hypothetical protein